MKGGRGKEEWKWVKSGGEAEQLPTVDRSTGSQRTDRRQNKGRKEERKGKGKVMGEMGAA